LCARESPSILKNKTGGTKMKKTTKQWSDWDEWLDCGGDEEQK